MPFFEWPSYTHMLAGIITFFITTLAIIFVWNRRFIPGGKYLIWLAVLGLAWSISQVLEFLSWEKSVKEIFDNFAYLPISFIPIVYFCFVNQFTGLRPKISRFDWGLMLTIPILTQVVVWTNPFTHWFKSGSIIVTMDKVFPGILSNSYGWWFWLLAGYIVLFLVFDLIVLSVTFLRAPIWARGKLTYLMIAMLLPLVSAAATIPQSANPNRDAFLLLSFDFSMIFLALGLIQVQILDLLPIARRTLLDQLQDAVIVLDTRGKIVEFNDSAKHYLKSFKNPYGKPIREFAPEFPDLDFSKNIQGQIIREMTYETNKKKTCFEMQISILLDEKNSPAGWLTIFRDITNRKLSEEGLMLAEVQTRSAFNRAQKQSEDLSLLRRVNEQLNQATSLRQALIPTLGSILGVAKAKQLWVILLGDEKSTYRKIRYIPNDFDTPLIFSEDMTGSVECIDDLLSGGLRNPKSYQNCRCKDSIEGIDASNSLHFSFPLRSGIGPLGVVNFVLDQDQTLDEDAIHMVETICDSLSVSIERVRLFRAAHDQRRIAETMQEISLTLTTSLVLNEVLDLLLTQIARLVPYDAGNVMFLDQRKAWFARANGYDFLGKKNFDALMHQEFFLEDSPILQNIIENKKSHIISDTHTDPNWQMTVASPYFRSWIGSPIIIGDQVVALFSLDKKENCYFTKAHAERLEALCSNAALAIQNARLYESGLKRIRELESMQTTLQDISSELDLKTLLNDITERAVDLLDASGGALGEYNKDKCTMDVIVGINNGVELIGTSIAIKKVSEPLQAKDRELFIVQEYSTYEARDEGLAKVFPHAMIRVPLVIGDSLLGALLVSDKAPSRVFTDDDIRLFTLFAHQATIAIANARLYTDAKKRAEEAETMRKAGAIVASSLEQKQVLKLILEQLAAVIPCDSASILLPRGDALEIVDGRGFKDNKPISGLMVPINKDQPGSIVFQEKKPIIVEDMEKEFPSFNTIYGIPIQSWIGVPLIFQKKTIGILAIDSLVKKRYTEEHARIAQAFADQVAIALENVRLYEEAVKSANRLEGLYRMSQRINANLKPEEVYRAIHKATIELMSPDSFILSMYDEDTQTINDVYFVDHGIPQKNTSRPLGEGLFSRAVRDRKTIMYNNFNLNMLAKTKAILVGDEKDPTMVRSLIIVPLKLGKKIKGVLSAQSYRADAFTEEDKETLELLAAHAVIALENAQLFSEIQELAITDPLTRIFNRRQFFDLADLEFDRTRRYKRPLSVIMFDIDHFKKVNDSYGHSIGDVVLEKIAETCRHALRDVDIFARYGGEEFVILLPETTATEAQLMAERLRQLVARTPMDIGSTKLSITLSFGVVEVDDKCRDTEELLDRSDQALYHSKRSGRNCVSIWTPSMRLRDDTQPMDYRRHH